MIKKKNYKKKKSILQTYDIISSCINTIYYPIIYPKYYPKPTDFYNTSSYNQSISFHFYPPFLPLPSPREIKIIYASINHLSLPNFRCIRFEACTRPAYPISTYTIASKLPPSPRYTSA